MKIKKEQEERERILKEAQERVLKLTEKPKVQEEDDPFAFIKKEKPKKVKVKVEGDETAAKEKEKKEESEGGNSFRKKKSPGKKTKRIMHNGMLIGSSSKNLEELKDDGTVPQVLVKETNESVDLMKKADEKLKQVLEFYLPQRKGSSNKSKASSKRSKSSAVSGKNPLTIKPPPSAAAPVPWGGPA